MKGIQRFWQKDSQGVEHEIASCGKAVFPTGQMRKRTPGGNYLQFTILDIMPGINLPQDGGEEDIELSPNDLLEMEDADGITITVNASQMR